ncbi:MAG: c-type cytochrome, partial [Gammaproteobacteria bacterium]|nr:c-type cytochrome [Gammaproteobacteria bacterium]
MKMSPLFVAAALGFSLHLSPVQATEPSGPNANTLYQQPCASCHGADRLGGIGPALLPENMGRLKPQEAAKVIAEGRAATQMIGYKNQIDAAGIQSLVDYIFTPLQEIPRWGEAEILASHIQQYPPGSLPDKPQFKADIDNLFIVVELGDHHATLLNGDSFEPIHRFPTRYALHGGPKYAEGGRYVYFASRDGWISKFDTFNLTYVAEVRAGINSRNLAVSHDGRFVIVANYLPHNLVILDAETLKPVRLIEARDAQGNSSRVSAVYTADPRSSFIVALKDIPEVWEISYQTPPPKGFGQWIHDHRADSG